MDMIEVDPKLFVTCRLCLEDMGHYQIVPIVQQQIKYCFDIEVQPFDGLPQLICAKCRKILTDFHTLKTSFCEKQDKLKINMSKKEINEICIQPQQNTVSSSQLAPDNTDKNARPKSRVRRLIESSESESSSNVVKYNEKSKTKLGTKWNWTGYKRTCVCLLCKSEWQTFKSYKTHRHLHGNMKKKHAQMFKKTCSVVLNKIDNKPNITGQNNIVVHNPNQIIEHRNSLYNFKYTKKSNDGNSLDNATIYDSHKASPLVDPESTDTETEMTIIRPKRRKRQVLSRSSNDTVVIESNANKIVAEDEDDFKPIVKDCNNTQNEQNDIEQCISIEDSDSDKDTVEFVQKTRQPFEARLGDFKIIQGIITTCVNAYHRRKESTEKVSDKPTSSESQLKHKVLSIGRKIINRPGFNWTGLLRYLERKNLDIEWATKALPSSNSKESNYIRVMTKLRGPEISDDNLGWEPVTPRPPASSVVMPDTTLSISRPMPPLIQISNDAQPPIDSAILFICSPPDPKNKLLNANPVPNPKQLPRKLAQPSESRINKPIAEPSAIFQNNEENDSSMPIITSTTSLAVTAVEDQTNAPPATTSSVEASAPRIKVKPVTELMSERILNSLRNDQRLEPTDNMLLNQSENIKEPAPNPPNQNTSNIVLNQTTWPTHSVPNVFMSNIVPQFSTAGQPIQLVPLTTFSVTPTQTYPALLPKPTPTTTKDANSKEEYVLLNTVELPNQKSNSPFKYLRKLLQMHNLTLLEPREVIPREFVCLIKFKVQFKQEPIDEPIVLCLSLYCHKNQFCVTVKDRCQRDINIDKVSPNWQWEILNVFRGDLVDKLLTNSQKHSQETHDSTNKFLCLLKSIYFAKLA